jgi:sulfite exporter TauE/SafE
MQVTVATTALLMGLAGGPHCVAMCGAACAGIGQATGTAQTQAIWKFQLGRVIGYAGLGALAAASMQGFGWLTVQSAFFRPIWSMFHVAMLLIGFVLLLKAQQPIWMEQAGRRIWMNVRRLTMGRDGSAAFVIGTFWSLLPCGLLYSALLVAGLTGNIFDGALAMGLFALGTSVSMTLGPLLWLRLRSDNSGAWGVRLAGLALVVSSGWALWMAYAHDSAPWCTTA